MGLFPTDDPQYKAVYAEEAAMVDASELIARALEASGLTRADLARALNVTRSEVTERLRGDRNITVRNLAATLHALGAALKLDAHIPAARPVSEPIDLAKYAGWTSPALHSAHVGERPTAAASQYKRPAVTQYKRRVGAR